MIRKIITIDEEKCNGCGVCADACHEGAIAMVAGKAKLVREDYCDGLGDCLPACPVNAISFVEREAPAYNEAAVLASKLITKKPLHTGCPGSACRSVTPTAVDPNGAEIPSQLRNFPVQIKLAPINAPFFNGAHLLIAADCTPFAYGNFHGKFMAGKITLIGCPKLDSVNYAEKLTEIIRNNNIEAITVTRMEVPCCGGLSNAVKMAVANSGKDIPLRIVTISTDGRILG